MSELTTNNKSEPLSKEELQKFSDELGELIVKYALRGLTPSGDPDNPSFLAQESNPTNLGAVMQILCNHLGSWVSRSNLSILTQLHSKYLEEGKDPAGLPTMSDSFVDVLQWAINDVVNAANREQEAIRDQERVLNGKVTLN